MPSLYNDKNDLHVIRNEIDKIANATVPESKSIAILFADLCHSAKYRIKEGHQKGYRRGAIHNYLVRAVVEKYGGKVRKEIGDEVMATFEKAASSVECALKIIETFNLINSSRIEEEKMYTKIGMSYGEVSTYANDDILGLVVDLAARIVSRAKKGQVWISNALREEVENFFPHEWFSPNIDVEFKNMGLRSICKLETSEEEYVPVRKFGFFASRDELRKYHPIPKDLESAKKDSEIYLVGRSLVKWTGFKDDISKSIRNKNLTFKLVFLDPKADMTHLPKKERDDLTFDLENCLNVFNKLRKDNRSNFSFRLTSNVIFDSLETFTKESGMEIIIYDISTGKGNDEKIGLEVKKSPLEGDILHTSLHDRARNFFDMGKEYFDSDELEEEIEKLSGAETFASEALRGNSVKSYFFDIPRVFASIIKRQEAPPPLCVEFEITNECKTECKMCKRWSWRNGKEELSCDEIKRILTSMSGFGVRNVVFSGGEPTAKKGFDEIIKYAKRYARMNVGILSSGCHVPDGLEDVVAKNADWIRISLEGSKTEIDGKVRKPGDYDDSLKFVERLVTKQKLGACKIGVCFTMVKDNVEDFGDMVEFCKRKKEIGFASFKFAHGNNGVPLCDEESIDAVKKKIEKNNLSQDRRMNLGYLDWFISNLGPSAIASGRPLQEFYNKKGTRCFTPYLFSLVDAFGDVYPCCHLYYDNSDYAAFNDKRGLSKLGNLCNHEFEEIWRSPKYSKIRSDLETIELTGKNAQCGDCTRHFFHNYMLTRLFEFYDKLCPTSQSTFDDYMLRNKPQTPIWF